MKTRILAFLLHHANREPGIWRDEFYEIKRKILAYYGTPDGEDLQSLPGKKCYACGGTGVYVGYNYSGYQFRDSCNRCYAGWYETPKYVVLHRITFCGYLFHQPGKSFDVNGYFPYEYKHLKGVATLGYKEFKSSPYTYEAHLWLYWFFNRRIFWKLWSFRALPSSQAGLLIEIHRLRNYWINELERRREHLDTGQLPEEPKPVYELVDDDDLPF